MLRPVLLALALGFSALAVAQEPESPLPPEQAPAPTGKSPAVMYLMQEFGISEEDAKERLAVQAELMPVAKRLEEEVDPGFSDTWIEHTPVFKVVFAFADAKDRGALLENLAICAASDSAARQIPDQGRRG